MPLNRARNLQPDVRATAVVLRQLGFEAREMSWKAIECKSRLLGTPHVVWIPTIEYPMGSERVVAEILGRWNVSGRIQLSLNAFGLAGIVRALSNDASVFTTALPGVAVETARRALRGIRQYLYHDHALDGSKRQFNVVFAAIEGCYSPPAPRLDEEIEALASYLTAVRQLQQLAGDGGWQGRAAFLDALLEDLRSAKINLAEGRNPVWPPQSRASLERTARAFAGGF